MQTRDNYRLMISFPFSPSTDIWPSKIAKELRLKFKICSRNRGSSELWEEFFGFCSSSFPSGSTEDDAEAEVGNLNLVIGFVLDTRLSFLNGILYVRGLVTICLSALDAAL